MKGVTKICMAVFGCYIVCGLVLILCCHNREPPGIVFLTAGIVGIILAAIFHNIKKHHNTQIK